VVLLNYTVVVALCIECGAFRVLFPQRVSLDCGVDSEVAHFTLSLVNRLVEHEVTIETGYAARY